MTQQPLNTIAQTSPIDALSSFATFFTAMSGSWNSERTYHYIQGKSQTREESQTTFDVTRLNPSQVAAVLESNRLLDAPRGDRTQGFRVSFLTRMASQSELVRAGTNLAFVVEEVNGATMKGGYYRDMGYEESGAVSARFEFDAAKMELRMVTFYSRVVSVDEIRLVDDALRLRRIVNYVRVGNGMGPVLLVGYGVEIKDEGTRLVE